MDDLKSSHPVVDTGILFSLDQSARPDGCHCYITSLIWLTMVYFGPIVCHSGFDVILFINKPLCLHPTH